MATTFVVHFVTQFHCFATLKWCVSLASGMCYPLACSSTVKVTIFSVYMLPEFSSYTELEKTSLWPRNYPYLIFRAPPLSPKNDFVTTISTVVQFCIEHAKRTISFGIILKGP